METTLEEQVRTEGGLQVKILLRIAKALEDIKNVLERKLGE